MILGSNFSRFDLSNFLGKEGNMLTYIFDELNELGIKIDPLTTIRNIPAKFNQNHVRIDDFFKPEENALFIEIINLSCIGSAHMPTF